MNRDDKNRKFHLRTMKQMLLLAPRILHERKAFTSYVILSFIGRGVDIGRLTRYNETEDLCFDVKDVVSKIIEKGIVANPEDVQGFVEKEMKKFDLFWIKLLGIPVHM